MDPMSGFNIRLVFTLPPRVVHCSTKDAYTWNSFPCITSLDVWKRTHLMPYSGLWSRILCWKLYNNYDPHPVGLLNYHTYNFFNCIAPYASVKFQNKFVFNCLIILFRHRRRSEVHGWGNIFKAAEFSILATLNLLMIITSMLFFLALKNMSTFIGRSFSG